MSSALLLSNAIAIAVLVAFHLQPDSSADQNVQPGIRHLQYQTAQLAVMHHTPENPVAGQAIDDQNTTAPPTTPRPESWVF
ncbi:hypothetical protein ACQKQA_24075 [Pseudomonas sp. NPDC089530]|uniref:hypothetical protein n=1 Tax=Pseudomonas sp. NPDC089530 TaxID=3390651 RepID=UPI003CFD813F